MKTLALALILCIPAMFAAGPVLIVADEFPAMEILAAKLKSAEGIDSKIVKQTEIPADLSQFRAMVVYIHGDIKDPAEKLFIDYARTGGRLILLHHSISSGKRRNQFWIPFVGVNLPYGEFETGGYRWIDPVTLDVVNLAPGNFVTTHHIKYDTKVRYTPSDGAGSEKEYDGFHLEETEVYLNHVFLEPHQILLGLKYKDVKTGKTYMQDRAGWYMRAGKGHLFYFMAGHSLKEFQNPVYAQMVVNAVTAPME